MNTRFSLFPPAPASGRPALRSTMRFASRALLAATLAAGSLSTGCGMRLFAHHAGPAVPPLAAAARHGKADAAPAAEAPSSPFAGLRAQMLAHPEDASIADRLARRLRDADSVDAAEQTLRIALARDPWHAPSLALLSNWLYSESRSAEAVTLLAPVREHPEHFSASARAALLAGLALHEEALGRSRDARATLALAGDDAVADPARLYLQLRAGDPQAATAVAEARPAGHSAAAQNNLGIVRMRAGDVAAARKAFETAIARDAALPGPYYNLAILAKFYLLDDAGAARWFAAYRERASDDPDSLGAAISLPVAHVEEAKDGGR